MSRRTERASGGPLYESICAYIEGDRLKSMVCDARRSQHLIPATAGIHFSAAGEPDQQVPGFAGTAVWISEVHLFPDYRPSSSVRGSSIAKLRCSVGCGVAVIRPTPSGASKRCQVFCGTMITIPALRKTDCGP